MKPMNEDGGETEFQEMPRDLHRRELKVSGIPVLSPCRAIICSRVREKDKDENRG